MDMIQYRNNWMVFTPTMILTKKVMNSQTKLTLGLTMISMWREDSSTTRCIAFSLIHKLLVLKILERKHTIQTHKTELLFFPSPK